MSVSQQDEPFEPLAGRRVVIAMVLAPICGVLFVLLPYLLVWTLHASGADRSVSLTSISGYNSSLTLLFPVVQGFALALALGSKRYSIAGVAALIGVLAALEITAAGIFLREGVICLIILSPLIYAMMAVGALLGRLLARRNASRALQVSFVPLIMLAVFAEAAGPKPEFASAVADSVVVDAPPEYVWRYVLTYPENNSPPEYWLWQIGLPYPRQSVAEAERVGAVRACNFSTGISFQERIVELEPNEVMTFEVTRQPDHPEVIGHFQFDRGQVRLTRNADGTTTITATSWYRLFVRPAAYFDWWTADITRQVHFRVLNHMKALAEADYEAAQRREAARP